MPVLQARCHNSVSRRVGGQVIEHQLAVTQAAKLRTHPHALDLPVLGAEEFDPAAAGRSTVIADDEERHSVGDQLLHAETMTALARIERRQMRVELRNQRGGVRTRGMLRGDDGGHSVC